jgi:hypothetical protein
MTADILTKSLEWINTSGYARDGFGGSTIWKLGSLVLFLHRPTIFPTGFFGRWFGLTRLDGELAPRRSYGTDTSARRSVAISPRYG